MYLVLEVFLVLGLSFNVNCDLQLRVFKNAENNYTPVFYGVVEREGSNFSLSCELNSSSQNNSIYDDQIVFTKVPFNVIKNINMSDKMELQRLTKDIYTVYKSNEINKVVHKFWPLRQDDRGSYICSSLKYNIFRVVHLAVKNLSNYSFANKNFKDISTCSNQFKCSSTEACIPPRYTCDGKVDCKDGSDEDPSLCNDDPCEDKLQCDDGRCIPKSWCCDKNIDPNCTVVHKPPCCKKLDDSYMDDDIYPVFPLVPTTNYTHYYIICLFVGIALFILTAILILLRLVVDRRIKERERTIMSLQENINISPNIILFRSNCQWNRINYEVCSSEEHDVSSDEPPSYCDVVRNEETVNEPPPPYSSSEFLNITRT